jgi:uncharacterized membrane protein
MKYSIDPYNKIDVLPCLLISIGLATHAYLSSVGLWSSTPLSRAITMVLGISLLVIPGYCICRSAGLDRFGIATLAGLSITLSLSILAVIGAFIWLITQTLSFPFFEMLVACLITILSILIILKQEPTLPYDKVVERLQALFLFFLVLSITIFALSSSLPASPSTYFTEFYLVQTEPVLIVGIHNLEQQAEAYNIVVESDNARTDFGPIEVSSGERWQGTVELPTNISSNLTLLLYKNGDNTPYRKLWIR